jgi:hypothetical protein
VAERIDRDVDLGALAALGSVVGSAGSDLRRGLQRAAVDHCRRWLTLAARKLPQQRLHVLDDPLETPSPHPARHLRVSCGPGRKIVRHQTSLVAALHDVPHGIEDSLQSCCRDALSSRLNS